MEGKVAADEHFVASRGSFLFGEAACMQKNARTNCSSAAFLLCQPINHFTPPNPNPI